MNNIGYEDFLKETFSPSDPRSVKIKKIKSKVKNSKQLSLLGKNFNYNELYHAHRQKMDQFLSMKNIHNRKETSNKEECFNFLEYYSNLKNPKEKEFIINHHHYSPFKDILNEYDRRHYKPPYLTDENNLFKKSPLLLPKDQMHDFYKTSMNKAKSLEGNILDKNLNYIEKLEHCMSEKKHSTRNFNSQDILAIILAEDEEKKEIDLTSPKAIKRIMKENKYLKHYNKKVEEFLNSGELNTKKKHSRRQTTVENYRHTKKMKKRVFSPLKFKHSIKDNSKYENTYQSTKNCFNTMKTYEILKHLSEEQREKLSLKTYIDFNYDALNTLIKNTKPENIYNDIRNMQNKIQQFKSNGFKSFRRLYEDLPKLSKYNINNLKNFNKADNKLGTLDTKLLDTIVKL